MSKHTLILILFFFISFESKALAQYSHLSDEELRMKALDMGYTQDQINKARLSSGNHNDPFAAQENVIIQQPDQKQVSSFKVRAFSDNSKTNDLDAFGYNIFNYTPGTFEPSVNLPVPQNYVVGPGDELIITLWGETQLVHNATVNQNGDIHVPDIGLVNVNGLTMDGLKNKLHSVLGRSYSTMNVSSQGGYATNLDVSTGKLRSVKVFLLGEVNTPGGYTLPSLSTSFTALYYCGGPTINGSLRNIQIIRRGRIISEIDIYHYLLAGDKSKDVRLEDEDIIFVPPVGKRVAVVGKIFRPAIYELKSDELVKDLLKYAGGINFNAYFDRIHIERVIPFSQRKQYTNDLLNIDLNFESVEELKQSSFSLEDGDVVNILGINKLPENRVSVTGFVRKPGTYELSNGLMTIRDLVLKADSLLPEAFVSKAVLIRTLPTEKKEIISFDLQKALNGERENNYILQNKDEVKIYNDETFFPTRSVEILGAVKNPGTYTRFENMTLSELIILAGGLTQSATSNNIEIARLDTTSQTVFYSKFIVDLPGDFWSKNKKDDFVLQNFDRVVIKEDPNKTFKGSVRIDGEVEYPGAYSILYEGERIADFVKRSGGFKSSAYLEGMYIRRSNPSFMKNKRAEIPDSIIQSYFLNRPIVDQSIFTNEFSNRIPIIWDDVIKNSESVYNIPLEPGDVLVVPKNPNVVYVIGEIGIPSTVPYKKGASISYYIKQAGGYIQTSAKGEEIVVLPNGKKWSSSGFFLFPDPDIHAGSVIYVPAYYEENKDSWPVIRDIVSVVSGAAVLVLTITNLTK